MKKMIKKTIAPVLCVIMVFGCAPVSTFAVDSVPEGYIGIYDIADLYFIRNNLSANYILMNDIDLTDDLADGGDWNEGIGWTPLGITSTGCDEFTGVFDGNNYTLTGLRIDVSTVQTSYSEDYYYSGLFGINSGRIINLSFENVDVCISIEHHDYASTTSFYSQSGAVCGLNNGEITNCHVNGSFTYNYNGPGGYSGGICAENKGTISFCSSSGEMEIISTQRGGGECGGIVALSSSDSTVARCWNNMNVSLNFDAYKNGQSNGTTIRTISTAGGIIGHLQGGNCYECWNSGKIYINLKSSRQSATSIAVGYLGGIIGWCRYSTVHDVYNCGAIEGIDRYGSDFYLGGIVGSINTSTLSNSYNVGSLATASSTYPSMSSIGVGGIGAQVFDDTSISNSYYLNNISVDVGSVQEVGTAKSNAVMKYQNCYTGFDFDNIWGMFPDSEYKYAQLRAVPYDADTGDLIPATGITLTPSQITLNIDDSSALTAVLTPEDSTDEVTFTSSNDSVATVDGSGTVTAVSQGTATITATATSGVSATCTVTVTETAYSVGDIIEYGNYPQSDVTAELGSVLNSLEGTWKSYTYMRYKDVVYNGNKYRGLTFDTYRPCPQGNYNSGVTLQQDNGYNPGTVYWFKYEPIKWRVLDPSTGLVLCDSIIDSQAYRNCLVQYGEYYYCDLTYSYYANNYAESSIRQWLNNDFYNTAFLSDQKSNIKTSTLNNENYLTISGTSGFEQYDSVQTEDNIFLLSYDEVINSEYGFSTEVLDNDMAKRRQGSDYAKSQGLNVFRAEGSEIDGNSSWWLRTSGYKSVYACDIGNRGTVTTGYYVNSNNCGVCPAMHLGELKNDTTISLQNETYTVTYIVDGQIYATQEYELGEAIVSPETPTVEGYIFTGWTPDIPYTMPATDLTFYATFVEKSYKLTFVVNGEETSEMVRFNSAIESPGDPVVDGYRFKGWDTVIPETMPAHDLTITALLSPIYTLTIGLGEDEIEMEAGEERELEVTAEPEPEETLNLTWTSSDEDVATVDEDGTVTGVSCGETTVTVTTDDGDSASVTIIINHKYTDETVDPTCTEDGYDKHTCSVCGDEYTDNHTDALGHDYIDETVESSCTGGGYTKHVCQRCGHEYTDNTSPANGHTFRNEVVEPTCTEGGYILHTCTVCGYSYISDETPAKGHTYKTTVVEPTCDDEGYTEHTCVDCGDTYEDNYVSANGHHYTEVTVVAPTCTEMGYTLHTCPGCGDSYRTDEVNANGHDFETLVQQATCTQEGGTVYTCKVCGFAKIDNKTPALGHNYVAKVTPATCGVGGYTTYTCSRCGSNYISDETPALEHNYEPFEVHTTCIQDGCTISICSNCGRAKRSDITPATGHSFGNWTVVRNASENEEGLEQRRCTKCGYTEDRLIPMLERTTYFATFVADGKTVATVEFLKGATSIDEPAVPHKDRYEGKWSDYTLTNDDITITAEYTLIDLDTVSGIESGKTATYNTATGEATINIYAASEGKTVVSTTSEKVPLDIILVVDQSGSMADKLGGSKTKQQALKTASTDFVNSVYADAVENDVNHRIAIVGFGMGSQSAQGYSAYQNTEILTTGGNPVQYNNATAQNYANALVKVNNGGNLNATITTAINNIDAKGATAADYGLSMANSIFANTDGEGRQRIVVFMTDGAPTYRSDFSRDVANAAVLQANQLKNTYGATVYSVGVMSYSEAADSNIDTFMNYVSSNYADVENIGRTYTKQNDSFYISVNNTNALSGVFTEIVTENITRTTDFDNLTVIDTISKYFTLTEKQERELRIAAIETYGVKNSDITITRNENGTTTVIIRNLHPVDDGTKFIVNLSFKVSADEDALKAGNYSTNTEDAGLIIGDGENYECVFDAPTVNIPADRTLSVFKINGEVYALLNADSANIPETDFIGDYEFTGWNPDAGTEIEEGVTEYNAVYVSKQDYVLIWNTDEGTQRLTVTPGEIIDEPSPAPDNAGNTFKRWNGEVPVTMPAGNLEFTAVYGDHEHNYNAEIITPVTCLADGTTRYTCSICGHTYTETVVCPGEHKWIAVTGSANTETGYEEFECEVCGEHCERTLEYTVTGTNESGSGVYNSITTELNCVNANGNNTQPEGNVSIVVPVSDYFDGAEDVDVYRVDGDGNRTECESDYSYGILSFFTNHFSTYEFVATYTEPCMHKDENNDGMCDNCGKQMTYTKDIIVDGNKIGEVTFTYGDTELTGLPDVPEKTGYTGEWDYTITGSELQIQAKYTPITYYATFMADGKQVAKVPFTVETTSITAPKVPAKVGYTGKWSKYTLGASDITIQAVYTKIDNPEPPTPTYKLPTNFNEQTAAYNTMVTVNVKLNNIPEGAKVYINGKEATVNGNTYSADIGHATSTKNVKVEVKYGTKVLDSTTLTVKVDTGFFAKLISFFSNFLFNMFSWKKVNVNF